MNVAVRVHEFICNTIIASVIILSHCLFLAAYARFHWPMLKTQAASVVHGAEVSLSCNATKQVHNVQNFGFS